ncbi:MAG: hypothetical protein QOI24_637 [Acidobacteriota bacterium]|nr:hypothetical protein [Acidobacteriota bacterium]
MWDGHNRVTLGRAINGNLLSNGTVKYLDVSTGQPSTTAALNADHYIHPDGAMYNALASTEVNVVPPAQYAGTVSMTPYTGCFRARIDAEVYVAGCHSAQGWGSGLTCVDKTAEISLYCPLVLDLNGDGIHTTSLAISPVSFWDRDFDGIADPSGWTDPDTEEAFLWIDGDDDRAVGPGELFGSAMFKRAVVSSPMAFRRSNSTTRRISAEMAIAKSRLPTPSGRNCGCGSIAIMTDARIQTRFRGSKRIRSSR